MDPTFFSQIGVGSTRELGISIDQCSRGSYEVFSESVMRIKQHVRWRSFVSYVMTKVRNGVEVKSHGCRPDRTYIHIQSHVTPIFDDVDRIEEKQGTSLFLMFLRAS